MNGLDVGKIWHKSFKEINSIYSVKNIIVIKLTELS